MHSCTSNSALKKETSCAEKKNNNNSSASFYLPNPAWTSRAAAATAANMGPGDGGMAGGDEDAAAGLQKYVHTKGKLKFFPRQHK